MSGELKPYPKYRDSGLAWLGKVPEHWEVRRIKFLLREKNHRSVDGKEQLLRVSQYSGVTERKRNPSTNGADTRAVSLVGYKKVETSDLVINIMLAWNGSLGVSRYSGIVSPAYCVYRFNSGVDPKYYHELLRTPVYKRRIKNASTGVVESRLRLYTSDLGNIEALLPPPSEQAAIAKYLAHATAKIDAAIAAKKNVIALLEEEKRAIIQQAVTKGLDPKAKMKDSGVPWIGEIPEGWQIRRVKSQFRLRIEKSGIGHGLELLSIYAAIGVRPRRTLEQKGNRASSTDDYWIVHKGDLIVNKLLAWMGAIGVSGYEGVTSPAYDILSPISETLPEYAHFLFRTKEYQNVFRQYSRGIMDMRLRLYFDQFGQIAIPLPTKKEQQKIISSILSSIRGPDDHIKKFGHEISLLREYRTRLVADVVTGKLDVREAAAGLPEIDEAAAATGETDAEIESEEDEEAEP